MTIDNISNALLEFLKEDGSYLYGFFKQRLDPLKGEWLRSFSVPINYIREDVDLKKYEFYRHYKFHTEVGIIITEILYHKLIFEDNNIQLNNPSVNTNSLIIGSIELVD